MWICADPLGHLQATGVDAAGRKQYLYHARWRELRDRQKFDQMVDFARALPRLRRRDARRSASGDELDRRARAGLRGAAARRRPVPDRQRGVRRRRGRRGTGDGDQGHVRDRRRRGGVRLPGQGRRPPRAGGPGPAARRRSCAALKRRRGGGEQLLAYRERRRWHDVRSEQINDYLKEQIGEEYSAKDFRTWNATVLAAVSLAADGREAAPRRARKRAIDGAVSGVAEVLGNTPAVARRSYIDPRVFDRYLSGWTIGGAVDRIGSLDGPDDRRRARLERAVLDLLHDDRGSPAVQRDVGQQRPRNSQSYWTRSPEPSAAGAVIETSVSATSGRSAMAVSIQQPAARHDRQLIRAVREVATASAIVAPAMC